ncbi:GerAB/ArcD/ProY family transporter [Desulfosporosinus sp. BICA1-9]|uniref:GerAB/ArcD/ProY family transporter n=1 Tax=Desulfosporosinus sp. BICA1-9 TaxID=1531958 RepID=UPI00054B5EF6|nr:GerAB/ArcD/ProY family transporter [Desulfosporosinus sp. BICA1-9]KJS46368.1 MAG: spore gernimation protein [Peptococcaceae bacterium BRH_c23]KJS89631.1 MAG: spore gernimation protein [Desulfosporosinus sp. BICA1-9]HBW39171.1 spore gernimation protein [Desulfosporosinus sp.]
MERISPHQFMTLGAAVLLGTTFLPVASIVTGVGGRDGWMSVLPGFAVGIPYGLMVFSLLEQYPQKNLLTISETLLGKWIGKIIGTIFILITGYLGGLLLGQVGDIYQVSTMPVTPLGVFYLGGLLLVFYLVNSGIEVLGFSEVVFPLIVIALLLNIGLSIPRIEQGELLPILSEGFKPIFIGAFKVTPFVMTYMLFLAGIIAFLPTGKQELRQLKTGVWRTVFLVGILDTLVVLIQMLVFGPAETIRVVYGLLVLGKMVEVSRTVAGVESIFLGVWFGAAVLKISSLFFAAIWGLETVFGLKGLKWNLAMGVAFLGIAFRFIRGPSLIMEIGLVDEYLIVPFISLWVPILWGVSLWKKGASVRRMRPQSGGQG